MRPPRQKYDTDIPELSQDLKSESHDGWIFEEDEFVAITLVNLPYIDGSALIAPQVYTHFFLIRNDSKSQKCFLFLNFPGFTSGFLK